MNIGGDAVTTSLRLTQTEVPLEIRKSFAALKHVPLFYSSYITKISAQQKIQNRLLICTIDHCYLCHPNGDVMRCFPFSFISHIFHDPQRKHVALIVPKEYDICFQAADTLNLIHVLETLRGLHLNDNAMEVRTLTRDRTDRGMSMLQDFYDEDDQADDLEYGFSPDHVSAGKLASPSSGNDVELDTINGSVADAGVDGPSGGNLSPAAEEKAVAEAAQRRRDNMKEEPSVLSWWGKIKEKLQPSAEAQAKKRKGVIIGWNDHWVLHDHPQMRSGTAEEVCLGKGQWALRLKKPADFRLEMFYRADGSIIDEEQDTDEEDGGSDQN